MIISVVTPTLNAERYLTQCIDSVQRNACPGVEIEHIVVDGGSTDGTLQIAHTKGLKVIAGKDSGIFDAMNKGFRAATGELVGFLGADDLLLGEAARAIAAEYRTEGTRWLCGSTRFIDGHGEYLFTGSAPPSWLGPKIYASLGWSSMAHMSTYMARDFFEELGGFNPDFIVSGDYELFARALSRCRYRRVRRPLAAVRLTGMNFSYVQKERGDRECAAIGASFGAKRKWQRLLFRRMLMVWIQVNRLAWSMKRKPDMNTSGRCA